MCWGKFNLFLKIIVAPACVGMTLVFFSVPAIAGNLTHLSFSNKNTSSRLILKLTSLPKYKVFQLSHPDRLVIDLPNTQLKTNLKQIKSLPRVVKVIRSGYPIPLVLRLVLDVAQPVQYKISSQKENLIIEINSTQLTSETKKTDEKKLAPIKTFVVVIDPGHGGRDLGAKGPNGTKEKDIVLAISKRLFQLINQQPHMRAILTRKGDYYVGLRGRLVLARKDKADLFVAVHADAYFNTLANGASVYALSQRGATSEAARWLAQRDNFSELSAVDLNELDNKSYLLRSVLIDLAQTATINDSLRLGTSLLNSLGDLTQLHYPRVEQARFVVLKSPDIPSALVEVGFVSNPREELRLRNPDYQNKLALALLNGIQKYVGTDGLSNSKINTPHR